MTQVAADALGFSPQNVRFVLGDSSLPRAPVSGGSQSAASVAPAVREAALQARAKLVMLAVAAPGSPLHGVAADDVTVDNGWVVHCDDPSRRDPAAAVIARAGGQPIDVQATTKPGDEVALCVSFVRRGVCRSARRCRTRHDSRTAHRRRLQRRQPAQRETARSQLIGGMVWGRHRARGRLASRRAARPLHEREFAEYHVPVNADIGELDVSFVDESDTHFNPLGIRGIGEIGITGVPAAIANAVYHATGVRVRDLADHARQGGDADAGVSAGVARGVLRRTSLRSQSSHVRIAASCGWPGRHTT